MLPPDLDSMPKGWEMVAILPLLEVVAATFSKISRALIGLYL
jgi:hypothetical protein